MGEKATLTAAQEFECQYLLCWWWQNKYSAFYHLTHFSLCMQSVGGSKAFQYFYSVILHINYIHIERESRPCDFNLCSTLGRPKMAWEHKSFYCTPSFCKRDLLITNGHPWHLAKYFSCPLLSTDIKLWGTKGMHFVLTQRLGTRLDRLTCRGANIWSCWRQDMAAAWTRESEWSCVIAHPTKQEERIVEIVAPLPNDII